jgi:hypothetical protein
VQLTLCWLALVVALVAGCNRNSPPPQSLGDAGTDQATLAAAALERGEYELAARLYRTALHAAPGSVVLHYGLGVSATFLDRRSEAVRELTWVLEHGETGSNEVRGARRWLLSVGALRGRDVASDTSEGHEQTAVEQAAATAARVRGTVTLGGVPQERMQVFLMEYPSRVKYFRLRTDERGEFQFKNVPPGVYKLTERAAGNPLWRLRVDLKPGQDVTLDLTDANSTKVRDDFPDSAQSAEPPRSS